MPDGKLCWRITQTRSLPREVCHPKVGSSERLAVGVPVPAQITMMRILFVCLSVWAEDCINVKYIEFVGSTEPVLWIRLFRCSFSQFGFGAVRVSVVYRFPFVYVYAIDALTFTVSFSYAAYSCVCVHHRGLQTIYISCAPDRVRPTPAILQLFSAGHICSLFPFSSFLLHMYFIN